MDSMREYAGRRPVLLPARNIMRSLLTDEYHHEMVTLERLSLQPPVTCVQCGVSGKVRLENTVKGGSVRLSWLCRACNHAWPVSDVGVERRAGVTDRRRITRSDRRN